MRSFVPACVTGVVCYMGWGCAAPDLVMSRFETTAAPTVNAENSVELPVRAVVKNEGGEAAGVFKIATEYTSPEGSFVVAFTVPGQSSIWYPRTSGPLAPGGEIAFAGLLTFHPSLHGIDVTLKATADSCSGDEFMPDYCRVNESDEDNNESLPVSVTLP